MHNESIFAPGPPRGNDINSRKKHEREVMCVTHEHNRLDENNLGFVMHGILFGANKAIGSADVNVALVIVYKIKEKDNV